MMFLSLFALGATAEAALVAVDFRDTVQIPADGVPDDILVMVGDPVIADIVVSGFNFPPLDDIDLFTFDLHFGGPTNG